MSAETLLELDEVTVRFGEIRSLDGASLCVGQGRVVGLIGANGAGKTTLLNAVCGFVGTSGSIRLGGRELSGMAPGRRARVGIGRTFQQPRPFGSQRVRDTLRVAADQGGGRCGSMAEIAALTGLESMLDRSCGALSAHQRVRLELARAVAAGARILLLDEPAAGLNEAEVPEFAEMLRSLTERVEAVLLIDHNLGLVLDVSDEVYMLESGHVAFHGKPGDVRESPVVIDAYLGDG